MKFTFLSKTLCAAIFLSYAFQSNAQKKVPGIDLSLMDTSVSPKNDFFNFVNGTWLKNTEIPAVKQDGVVLTNYVKIQIKTLWRF